MHLLNLVFSRIAPYKEYIENGHINEGDTIVLLTDDASTVEEVEKYHAKKYNWIYLKRKVRTLSFKGAKNDKV